ncbi:hypothetical protein SESBI_29505 [Sesbania bispinosa]|nr:hypothetical protein SESBI_29505 [Sesbania bispinosa]
MDLVNPSTISASGEVITQNQEEFVSDPQAESETLLIWKSQVLIPLTITEKTFAFMGPYDPEHLRNSSSFFLLI